MATTAERIKLLRKSKGLSQTEFGQIFGIVKSTVSSYERGNSSPDDDIKKEICKYFNVSVDYLIGASDIPNSYNNTPSSKLLSPSFPLTPHEMSVMIAYRAQVEMQPAVDRLLGVPAEEETVTLYSAAYSKDNTPEEIITISKAEWERLKSLPFTDQDL